MITGLRDHTHALLHRMVIWDAIETQTSGPDYEAAVTLTRRGLAARVGKRGRSGRVWFEPTSAGRDVIVRPPAWTKIFRGMEPVRGMPAPRKIAPSAPVRPAISGKWFDDLDGREEL